ncbi:MAG: aminoacyl-tRNA hydrolase [Candidatus Krumholzibacteriia bacterium]
MAPQLVVGLGNPGARYARNRHNIGWRVLDEVARRHHLAFAPAHGPWAAAGTPEGGLVLLRPLTYMNLSGEAVAAWSREAGVPVTGVPATDAPDAPDAPPPAAGQPGADAPAADGPPAGPAPVRPLVVCDDLALPLGAVRLRARGGSGGQNGLASVIAQLGGEEFPRLRLGIAPGGEPVPAEHWPDYVLADFDPEEEDLVAETVAHAALAVACWLDLGAEAAGSRFNRRGPAAPPA